MDLLDVAILALRLALVAVLYLFLALVMRGAVRGLRTAPPLVVPGAAEPSPATRGPGLRLVVLDAGGSGLQEGQAVELTDGAILGRGGRAEVVIADSSVSAEH